jgi:hypothetical protein
MYLKTKRHMQHYKNNFLLFLKPKEISSFFLRTEEMDVNKRPFEASHSKCYYWLQASIEGYLT